MTSEKIYIRAPAKVNRYLRILRRRPDGFHDIDSLMVPVALYDELSLTRTAGGITLVCDGLPGLPPERNLAFRAAQAFVDVFTPAGGVAITLAKAIPAGGGLGGGSSDAAAVLIGMNRLHPGLAKADRLAGLAASLGSDVPFFLLRRPAVVSGRGEVVTPLESPLPPFWAVLIFPGFGVPTAWAYKAWDDRRIARLTAGGESAKDPPPSGAENDTSGGFYNGFEDLVFDAHPVLRRIKTAIRAAGADGALLSGSGSTVFGVFPDEKAAQAAAAAVALVDPGWQVYAAQGLTGAFE